MRSAVGPGRWPGFTTCQATGRHIMGCTRVQYSRWEVQARPARDERAVLLASSQCEASWGSRSARGERRSY